MNETQELSTFSSGTELGELPDSVIAFARRLITDQIACQISAARLPWSQVIEQATLGLAAAGPATVVFYGHRLAADEAAFANSAFGHGNEVDDAHIAVRTHAGAVVVPAALATLGLEPSASGESLLSAVALGSEVMLRVARAAMPALMDERHHNTPSSAGPFGAAAAACRILGLSAQQTQQAFAVAAYHSGGLMQYTVGGGSVKRIQTAIGAKSGIRAALFAAAGVTGPSEILEGERGFLASFAGKVEHGRLVEGLGSDFLGLGTCFKRFNVKYRIHASIDGLTDLQKRHHLRFVDLRTVRVGVTDTTRQLVGLIATPGDVVQAQLSMRFALATVAHHGPLILADLQPTDLVDPEVLELARNIQVYTEPARASLPGGNWGCSVTIVTHSGDEFFTEVPAPRGSPSNPMTNEEVEEKFHRLVDPVLGAARAAAILEVLDDLETATPAKDLLPLLVR